MITVTLYGRVHGDYASVYADGDSVLTIRGTDSTTEVSLPDNTLVLAVYARDISDDQPGILIKLSNGFITGPHWRCTHSPPGDGWGSLTYNDSVWSQAVVYSWPWGEHDLHPAQYISGEGYGSYRHVYCRGWASKYIKHGD